MYEIVRTKLQQKNFEVTWEYFCNLYGWKNDPYTTSGVRYNLLLPKKKIGRRKKTIGTVEFIPYYQNNPETTVDGPGKGEFFKLDEIKSNPGRIWEIDKLCIHKEYQKQGYLDFFMQVFHDHASMYQPKYYVALIEKKFYRALRISYGLTVEQKGEPLIGPGTSLIPMIFDIEKFMVTLNEFSKESLNEPQRTKRFFPTFLKLR